jgi:hypothetical protein
MEKRRTQREILKSLIAAGKLTEQEATAVRTAPEWVVPIKELVMYLGGLLVVAGLVRIGVYAFEDASTVIISMAFYLVALVTGFFAFRLRKRIGAWHRFSEVLELGSMLTAALATGILITDAGLRAEMSAIICSAATFVWSLWRLRATRMVGAIGAGPSIFILSIMVTSEIDALQDQPPYLVGAAGLVLVALGFFTVPLAALLRVFGLILVAQSAIAMAGYHHGGFAVIVPIGLGAVAYAYGAIKFQVEMLVIGAVMIIVGVVMFSVMNIDNDIAQGLVISATGLVLLGATYFVAMQRKERMQQISATA